MPRKGYLLVYNDDLGERQAITNALDSMPEVLNWRWELPNSIFMVAEVNAAQLAIPLRNRLPNGRFLITELTPNSQGWLTPETWDFLHRLPSNRGLR